MKWGVFKTPDEYEVHVAPCDQNGGLQKGHKLSDDCSCICRARQTNDYGIDIVIHEEIN